MCVSRYFKVNFFFFFFPGLQYSRDRALPTVWPSMLPYLHPASSPQFGRPEYSQICVFHCEVRHVRICFSSLQWLMATKANFVSYFNWWPTHFQSVNVAMYTSGYLRKTFSYFKTDSVFFSDPVKFLIDNSQVPRHHFWQMNQSIVFSPTRLRDWEIHTYPRPKTLEPESVCLMLVVTEGLYSTSVYFSSVPGR